MRKLLLLILVLFSFSAFTVFAEEVEDIPIEEVEEPIVEDVGFFESLIVGVFDFVTSDEFTKLATSLGMLLIALYPFIKKYLSAKAQARYNSLTLDLMNWKQKADEYEKLVKDYAKIADNAIVQIAAIKDSLALGFDKSNLRQDVKDKIINRLNSVPKIEVPVVEEEPTKDDDLVIDEEKDNTLTEPIKDTNLEYKGW